MAPRPVRLLSGMQDSNFNALVYATTAALYLLGVWLHWPYGGGHIYSDIVSIFQLRICPPPPGSNLYNPATCTLHTLQVPYLQSFIEYPVLVAMFLYVNGVLGSVIAGDTLTNYYVFSAVFLMVPTLLAARELLRMVAAKRISRNRILWYFVATPTFVYLTLLNWYIIGVYLALFGTRKYLEGSRVESGVLFGLSAASNFVTAAPALGLLIASNGTKERLSLAASALGTYVAINAPFAILNPRMWLASFSFVYDFQIEGSWMQAILPSLNSPLRHDISTLVFGAVIGIMLWLRYKRIASDPVVFAFLGMFGYTFATYVYAPQINLALLPFFVLLPVSGTYWEFLAFDIANSMIIVVGYSQALQSLGITYPNFQPIDRSSLVFWVEVLRSIWVGTFLFRGVWGVKRRAALSHGNPALQGSQEGERARPVYDQAGQGAHAHSARSPTRMDAWSGFRHRR